MILKHPPADVPAVEEVVALYGLYGFQGLVVGILKIRAEAYDGSLTLS